MNTPFIGNQRTVEMLGHLADRQRLPTALLLTGAPHVGKGTLLRALGARVLGAANPAEIERHLDLVRIDPAAGAPLREVLVRLIHHTRQRPLAAPYRLVLLENLDRLTAASVSLLLKTVEDAPPFTRFFLAACARERVPLTIRSRALVSTLYPVGDAEVAAGLAARGVLAARAVACASLAGGRPGIAIALAADERTYARYRQWADIAEGRGYDEISRAAWPADGATPTTAEDFLVFLSSRLRHGTPNQARMRRTREALLMLRQHVPAYLVVEYALAPPA